MANAQKDKGDRGEREAVAALVALLPAALGDHAGRLMQATAQRKLGAGRREDTGDLWVLRDAAVQVKNMVNLPTALREAATGAQVQAGHGDMRYALGMAPIPRARAAGVRWLASCLHWPVAVDPDSVAVFGNPMSAVNHARNERIGVPRHRRIARVDRAGKSSIWVAPLEAWVAGYAEAKATPSCRCLLDAAG